MGENCSRMDTCQNEANTERINPVDESVILTYQNGNFNLPTKIPFQRQSTFDKIEKAAFNFCQQNDIDQDFIQCIIRIIAYRQQKVFLAVYHRLKQSDKQKFLQEVFRIPQDQIDLFYHNFVNQTQKRYSLTNEKKGFGKQQYRIPKYINSMDFTADEEKKFFKTGKTILQSGQVALVIMCAGSSSRFQNKDKFLEPFKLKKGPCLTILDLIFIRLKKSIDKNQPPIIITCNELNFKPIQNLFRSRDYYGLNKLKFRFMQVQRLPVLDLNGKYCLDEKYNLIKRPFGTARSVNQILKERNLQWLKQNRVKYVHFIGAQNLMQHPCDSLMLGVMKQSGMKVCAKTVGAVTQWQKLPRYIASNDKRIFLKYWNQLNSSISESSLYSAYKYPLATNSLIIQLVYLQELVKDYYTDIYLSQNYHIIRRKEKMINVSNNRLVTSESLTFQGDIRDLLACCQEPGLFYVDRNKNYVPVFSRKDEYPLEGSVEHYDEILYEEYKMCGQVHEYIKQMEK